MRKIMTLSAFAVLILASCVKNDSKCSFTDSTIVAPTTEQNTLKDSLTAHGITTATLHPSGFYYTINSQGNGKFISNLCTYISAAYKGSFFNGKIFDSTATGTAANFQLGQVIPGWQKGMPLISQGGNITLYIPPSLAYGPNDAKDINGNVVIPGNSYLVFTVNLVAVQ
jgi:FKBP-type peptidyl-prolyl cis-trans isomerase FkpA